MNICNNCSKEYRKYKYKYAEGVLCKGCFDIWSKFDAKEGFKFLPIKESIDFFVKENRVKQAINVWKK